MSSFIDSVRRAALCGLTLCGLTLCGLTLCSLTLCSLTASAAGTPTPSDRASTVSLRSATIDIQDKAAAVPERLAVSAAEPGAERFVLVKFPGPVSAAARAALNGAVERVLTYLPHDAFLVELTPGARLEDVLAETGAVWAGPFHPAYKLAPELMAINEAAQKDGGRRIVLVHVFPGADLEALAARLAEGGLEVVGKRLGGRFPRLRLLADAAQIAAWREPLALMAEVFFIDLEARRVLLNDTTVTVVQSGTVQSGGTSGGTTPVYDAGLYGEGQIVGVLDTGLDADMCYFRDPVRGLPPQNLCDGGTAVDLDQRKVVAVDFLWSRECANGIADNEWAGHDHGTHVAGTVAGDNFANPLVHDPGDGVAPGARLVFQDCGAAGDNCADCPGLGCPVIDLNPVFGQAYDQGARIHTNSWGDEENNPIRGLYSAGSEDADQFMWEHKDFLLVFAAGNSGSAPVTVISPSTAKNVVAVGATQRGESAEALAFFSSCGPTADGRVKPDVTSPGLGIVSADADRSVGSNNCGVRTMSGTSMAAPAVAGAAALVRQYFTDGFYPTGAAVPADGFLPSAALLKAALINSGHDMTGVDGFPSNCQGWGRVLLDDVLHFAGDERDLFVVDEAAGFAQGASGASQSFDVEVGAGEPFEVTLTWTDFPATPLADPQIVNDLDLEVTGPSGTFLGNVFSGAESATGGRANRLDTVEQVLIAAPVAGTYTVTVRAWRVVEGPQPFALVATGELDADTPPPPPPAGCSVEVDFDSGAAGWIHAAASTCGRGAFVAATPTLVQSAGITTQPEGDHTSGTGQAFFTAENTTPNNHDVDGGRCVALSPVYDVDVASEVRAFYFHGQRDTGDDRRRDYFRLEISTDGGHRWTSMVSIGDVATPAVWTEATTTVEAGTRVRLRVRVSDGPGRGGDLIEGGIDDVSICPLGARIF